MDVLAVHGDLADEAVVARCAAEIRARFGQIDILVNCAGGDIGVTGRDRAQRRQTGGQ